MVRNCGKGGKSHKSMTKCSFVDKSRTLEYKDIGQSYAKVVKMLGNNRCMLQPNDENIEVLGIICGRMRNKHVHRVSVDDIVLITFRDYQEDKVDIVHKYSNDEVMTLYEQGEISCKLANEEDEVDSNLLFIQDI